MKPLLLGLLLVSFSCISGVPVNSQQYEETWPFTVESGVVSCLSDNSIIFESSSQKFALNGVASSRGYLPLEPIWKLDQEFLDFQRSLVITEGKSLKELQDIMGSPRVNVAGMIKLGLSLCNQ